MHWDLLGAYTAMALQNEEDRIPKCLQRDPSPEIKETDFNSAEEEKLLE